MLKTTLILAVMTAVLVAPLLCGAVVMIHGCICDSVECCPDEATCEPDPCGDVFKESRQDREVVPGQQSGFTCAGLVVDHNEPIAPLHLSENKPFPDSDVPLRI